MSRSTIDFGIDLGTTNSAISVLNGTRTDIFKNNKDNDITPSAVYIDKRDQIYVGERAKKRLLDERSADDAYIEFKQLMGTAHEYRFKSSGKVLSPEQLSAEVLKSLRGNVQQRLGEDISSAVITVPAAFKAKQCASTKVAGELAGLYQCPLVQEPVAAALAYGYQSDLTKEFWLVYDFGGGTFDAAIMKAEDGSIHWVNHGGDKHLGGSHIDWAVVEKVIIPALREEYNLPDFRRGNQTWRTALNSIKSAVEDAKIELSQRDATSTEICGFRDADGEEIDFEYKLTARDLISVAEPLIMQSVNICKRVLKEKKLTANAMEKVILVGGPTKAPYFRAILKDQLGIEPVFSVDPLTVVSRGAAVFAGTQRITGKSVLKATTGQYDLDLRYKPMGADDNPTVRGSVIAEKGNSIEGYTIEFVNQQTHWRSGKVPIKDTGTFRVDLLAEKGVKNDFKIELLDETGRQQKSVPDSISYIIKFDLPEQTIIHNISVGLANNDVKIFFEKGGVLPARASRTLHSSHAVKKGTEDHILNIPVVEGGMNKANRNSFVGMLVIKGNQVRRDVPAGSEVDVTIQVDESRLIKVKAYIPILDEEFEVEIDYNNREIDSSQLKREHEEEMARLDSLRDKAVNAGDTELEDILDEIDTSDRMDAVEQLIDAAEADPSAAENAENQLLKIKIELDQAEQAIEWPSTVADAKRALENLKNLVDQHATQYRDRFDTLQKEVEGLIKEKRPEPLKKKIEQVMDLHREILFDQPGFWMELFKDLIDDQASMSDQAGANRLINQGQQFIQQGNVDGLRRVDVQLLGLLPKEVAEKIQHAANISSVLE